MCIRDRSQLVVEVVQVRIVHLLQEPVQLGSVHLVTLRNFHAEVPQIDQQAKGVFVSLIHPLSFSQCAMFLLCSSMSRCPLDLLETAVASFRMIRIRTRL